MSSATLSSSTSSSTAGLCCCPNVLSFQRKGLVEVDHTHRKFVLTAAIRFGLRGLLASAATPEDAPDPASDSNRAGIAPSDYDDVRSFSGTLVLHSPWRWRTAGARGTKVGPESDLAADKSWSIHEGSSPSPFEMDTPEPPSSLLSGCVRAAMSCMRLTNADDGPRAVNVDFRALAPAVFAELRHAMGISNREFIQSVAPEQEDINYLQFLSNSHTKAGFFLTHDRRFLLKLETSDQISSFMGFIRDYIRHFMDSPHSLIVKILGVYFVRVGKDAEVPFIVMQSVFWPSSRIREKFDLKGCLKGRYQAPRPDADPINVVLKDVNFGRRELVLGQIAPWFREQLTRDVTFLQAHGVVDYSVLVGVQPLSEERRPSVANFANSIRRSSLAFPSSTARSSISLRKSSLADVGLVQEINRFFTIDPDGKLAVAHRLPTPPPPPRPTSSRPGPRTASSYASRLSSRRATSFDVADDAARARAKKYKRSSKVRFRRSVSIDYSFSGVRAVFSESDENENETETSSLQVPSLPPLRNVSRGGGGQQQQPRDGGGGGDGNGRGVTGAVRRMVSASRRRISSDGDIVESLGHHADQDLVPAEDAIESVSDLSDCDDSEDSDRDRRGFAAATPYSLTRMCHFDGPENRRLLPDSDNGVHIIDGPRDRYYVGIIDIFKRYGVRERVWSALKSAAHCDGDHSSADPDVYADRIISFFRERAAVDEANASQSVE